MENGHCRVLTIRVAGFMAGLVDIGLNSTSDMAEPCHIVIDTEATVGESANFQTSSEGERTLFSYIV